MKTLLEIKEEIDSILKTNNCFLSTRYCVSEDDEIIQIVRIGGKEVIDVT
jgi:predicted DNA-binding helix-hairpin-helix protein